MAVGILAKCVGSWLISSRETRRAMSSMRSSKSVAARLGAGAGAAGRKRSPATVSSRCLIGVNEVARTSVVRTRAVSDDSPVTPTKKAVNDRIEAA